MNKKAAVVTSLLDYIILLSMSSSEECSASKEGNGLGMFGGKVCVEFHGCFKSQIKFLWIATSHAMGRGFCIGLLSGDWVDGTSVTSPAIILQTQTSSGYL